MPKRPVARDGRGARFAVRGWSFGWLLAGARRWSGGVAEHREPARQQACPGPAGRASRRTQRGAGALVEGEPWHPTHRPVAWRRHPTHTAEYPAERGDGPGWTTWVRTWCVAGRRSGGGCLGGGPGGTGRTRRSASSWGGARVDCARDGRRGGRGRGGGVRAGRASAEATREQAWAIAVSAAAAYRARVGHREVPCRHVESVVAFDGWPEDVGSRVWITTTRSRRAKLSAERIAVLDALDMRWT
ncbi:Helicase associated domain protein [Embleya sp. NPDC059213]